VRETRVYLLDGGSLELDGFHIFWNKGPAGAVRIPCYSVLVVHDEGNLVFDTGFDLAHVETVLPFERPGQSAEQTIPGQLAKVGVAPGHITHLVNSHFHFDHCGGNKHLSNAAVYCHEAEFRAADSPEPFEVLGYSDVSFAPELARRQAVAETDSALASVYAPRIEQISGDQEIFKGVRIIETPGHSAGHYSLLVELGHRRPMLFTADAAYGPASLDTLCISGFHFDPVASIRSMRRLKQIAEETGAELFFSHDASSYAGYLKAPGYYY